MSNKNVVTKDGIVREALMGGDFRIELEDGEEAIVSISGKMRKFHIRILPGDKITAEFSPYDLTRGRVVYRFK